MVAISLRYVFGCTSQLRLVEAKFSSPCSALYEMVECSCEQTSQEMIFFFCSSRLLIPGGRVEFGISWLTQEEHFTASAAPSSSHSLRLQWDPPWGLQSFWKTLLQCGLSLCHTAMGRSPLWGLRSGRSVPDRSGAAALQLDVNVFCSSSSRL